MGSNKSFCLFALLSGGIQSNHCRATAVASRYVDLDTHLILRTSRALVDQDPGLVGNLMVERLVGAHVHLVTKEEYVQYGSEALTDTLQRKLAEEGRTPYVIPVGGSNALVRSGIRRTNSLYVCVHALAHTKCCVCERERERERANAPHRRDHPPLSDPARWVPGVTSRLSMSLPRR